MKLKLFLLLVAGVSSSCTTAAKPNLTRSVSDFKSLSATHAMLAVAKATNETIVLKSADLDTGEFKEKSIVISNAVNVPEEDQFLFADGYPEGFKIGYVPAGKYVHTKTLSYRATSKGQSVNTRCFNTSANTYNFEPGKLYYMHKKTGFRSRKDKLLAQTLSPSEAMSYVTDHVSEKLGERVSFQPVSRIGRTDFNAEKSKALLGFIGTATRQLYCPLDNTLTYKAR